MANFKLFCETDLHEFYGKCFPTLLAMLTLFYYCCIHKMIIFVSFVSVLSQIEMELKLEAFQKTMAKEREISKYRYRFMPFP